MRNFRYFFREGVGNMLSHGFMSFAAIGVTYVQGSDALACIMVRFNDVFSISLRIDGASMVFGTIVSTLWPIITVYAIDYMSHEGSENRFFSFWLMAYGVVLGVAYSEDFLSLYLFYELLTLSTLPLVMHAADEKARYAGREYLIYSLSGAAFAFIGIVFLLYPREFSVQAVGLTASLMAMYLIHRGSGSDTWGGIVIGCSILAICVVAVLGVAVFKAGKNDGKLKKLGDLRIVSQDGDYKLIYAVLAVCALAIVAALAVSSIAYYGLWVLAIGTFLLAVYYTVKMM